MNKKPIEDRFHTKYEKSISCWHWTSAVCNGYGVIWNNDIKGNYAAHRLSYEIHKGDIPEGMLIRHTCNNKLCVNPDHLQIGTPKDNKNDSMKDKRHAFGTRQTNAKIRENTAWRIKMCRGFIKRKEVADLFGVSERSVKHIWQEETWVHVKNDYRYALSM